MLKMCKASGNWVNPRKQQFFVLALGHLLTEWMLGNITVLVSSGCYNKNTIDWVAWATNIYFSQFWRLRSLRSGWWHGQVLVPAFLLVSTWWRERTQDSLSPYKAFNSTMGAPPPWSHPNLITSQSPPPSNIITLGIKTSTYGFGKATNIQSIAITQTI